MRYIIEWGKAEDQDRPVRLTTYDAEIADNPQDAARQHLEKHPNHVIYGVNPSGEHDFERYGVGARTEEEQQAVKDKLQANYDAARKERKEAELTVSTYEPDEFAAVIDYLDRRAAEKTQNLEGVHVGDLFYVTWGYEQTNYNYFQVVGLRGRHTIVVRENQVLRANYGFMCGLSRPIRNQFKDERRYTMRTRFDERLNRLWINAPEGIGTGHCLMPCRDGQSFEFTAYA